MEEALVMTGKEAIQYVAENFGVQSMYALAKSLSDETLTVQTIQIKNYLNGRRMSKKVAERFNDVYGIIISDVYIKADWAESKDDI